LRNLETKADLERLVRDGIQGSLNLDYKDAANYVLALPQEQVEHCNRWRHAAQLLLDQADVAAVSRQVHLALFYEARLDLNAMSR
jgi:hypothetical protein